MELDCLIIDLSNMDEKDINDLYCHLTDNGSIVSREKIKYTLK